MTLMETSRGKYGAKRASWQETGYREIIERLIDAHPKATIEEIAKKLDPIMLKNDAARITAWIYVTANVKQSMEVRSTFLQRRDHPASPPVREQLIEREATEITTRIVNNLLDFIMPGGKTLGQSTGAECSKAAVYHGERNKWLLAIAEKVGARGIVGDKLTNADLKKLLSKAKH